MTSSPVAVFRLLLGSCFGLAALVWLFRTTTAPERVLMTFDGRGVTRLDLAAVPLLYSGVVLVLLAALARRPRPAKAATVWLVLAGVIGWVGAWWVSSDPFGDGAVLAHLAGHGHGLTQSDVLVLPVISLAVGCGVAGAVAVRSAIQPHRLQG